MDWNYLAGFFDGEGNIHIIQNKKRKSYQILIRIYSSEEKILKKIKEFVGWGNIYIKKASLLNPNRLTVYEYVISKKEKNLNFLKNIFQFSILKKAQINYLLENFNFNMGKRNENFDIDEFRKLIKRKNIEKLRNSHTFIV